MEGNNRKKAKPLNFDTEIPLKEGTSCVSPLLESSFCVGEVSWCVWLQVLCLGSNFTHIFYLDDGDAKTRSKLWRHPLI